MRFLALIDTEEIAAGSNKSNRRFYVAIIATPAAGECQRSQFV